MCTASKVPTAISKLGCTDQIFDEFEVKIKGSINEMCSLLPVTYRIAGDVFIFQQENASAYRNHNTFELLCHETFIH